MTPIEMNCPACRARKFETVLDTIDQVAPGIAGQIRDLLKDRNSPSDQMISLAFAGGVAVGF